MNFIFLLFLVKFSFCSSNKIPYYIYYLWKSKDPSLSADLYESVESTFFSLSPEKRFPYLSTLIPSLKDDEDASRFIQKWLARGILLEKNQINLSVPYACQRKIIDDTEPILYHILHYKLCLKFFNFPNEEIFNETIFQLGVVFIQDLSEGISACIKYQDKKFTDVHRTIMIRSFTSFVEKFKDLISLYENSLSRTSTKIIIPNNIKMNMENDVEYYLEKSELMNILYYSRRFMLVEQMVKKYDCNWKVIEQAISIVSKLKKSLKSPLLEKIISKLFTAKLANLKIYWWRETEFDHPTAILSLTSTCLFYGLSSHSLTSVLSKEPKLLLFKNMWEIFIKSYQLIATKRNKVMAEDELNRQLASFNLLINNIYESLYKNGQNHLEIYSYFADTYMKACLQLKMWNMGLVERMALLHIQGSHTQKLITDCGNNDLGSCIRGILHCHLELSSESIIYNLINLLLKE